MHIQFNSFGRHCSGRVITHGNGYVVANSRNPYGTHNVVLVDETTGEAIRHGSQAVINCVAAWMGERPFRKVMKHLAKKWC